MATLRGSKEKRDAELARRVEAIGGLLVKVTTHQSSSGPKRYYLAIVLPDDAGPLHRGYGYDANGQWGPVEEYHGYSVGFEGLDILDARTNDATLLARDLWDVRHQYLCRKENTEELQRKVSRAEEYYGRYVARALVAELRGDNDNCWAAYAKRDKAELRLAVAADMAARARITAIIGTRP